MDRDIIRLTWNEDHNLQRNLFNWWRILVQYREDHGKDSVTRGRTGVIVGEGKPTSIIHDVLTVALARIDRGGDKNKHLSKHIEFDLKNCCTDYNTFFTITLLFKVMNFYDTNNKSDIILLNDWLGNNKIKLRAERFEEYDSSKK